MDIDAEKREAQRMRERAERDTLTGLYNKGTMEAKADHALGALMPGENAVLLMIDIDNFKQVNDFYGHLSGDVMLTEAARMLQDMFRAIFWDASAGTNSPYCCVVPGRRP